MNTVFQVDPDDSLEPYAYESATLEAAGIQLRQGNCLTVDEVVARAGDAQVLWLAWRPGVDRALLEALPSVELVVRWGVGFDQIDVPVATELGVAVANAPTYGTIDVAEHVIALLMTAARRVVWYHAEMQAGGWPAAATGGKHHRIFGRTLGLIGVGRIGAAVAERARGLGIEVVGYDPAVPADQLAQRGVRAVELDELLATADYVSLHVPLNEATHHLADSALLHRMKPGAGLLNASRGKVVDTAAVVDALDSGHLAWAALDVFEDEPLPTDSPLRGRPDVVLTPHVAAFSEEAWQNLREEMCLTSIEWFRDGWAERIVNPAVRDHLRRPR
jgi:D-3-phosphoglycerate dehydrogenase